MEEKEHCQIYQYDEESFRLEQRPADYVAKHFKEEYLSSSFRVNWLNFHSIACEEDVRLLSSSLGLHRTTVEDIFKQSLRPKIEEYQEYLFFSIKSPNTYESTALYLEIEQISFVLGRNYLISLQEKSCDHFTEVRYRIENKKGIIRSKGPDFLLYRMLEGITDNFFEMLESINLNIHEMDKVVGLNAKPVILREIEDLKRVLFGLRKIVVPMREVTTLLEESDSEFIEPKNSHFFRTLKDNCLLIIDEIEASHQILEGLTNLYYASQNQRLNETMKTLTIVNTIFVPLTFLAGVYGMNFKYLPELKYPWAYPIIWCVFITVAVSLLIYFKRKKWL